MFGASHGRVASNFMTIFICHILGLSFEVYNSFFKWFIICSRILLGRWGKSKNSFLFSRRSISVCCLWILSTYSSGAFLFCFLQQIGLKAFSVLLFRKRSFKNQHFEPFCWRLEKLLMNNTILREHFKFSPAHGATGHQLYWIWMKS